MNIKGRYTIGEVSRLCDVTIRTLRYYDNIGLLNPEFQDKKTNYRYYSNDEILKLQTIKELRFREFSLQDIKDILLADDISVFLEKLKIRNNEVSTTINKMQNIRYRLENHINVLHEVIELESTINVEENNNVIVREIPVRKIASIRRNTPFGFTSVCFRFIELFNLAKENNLNITHPYLIRFHEDYKHINVFHADYEVCAMLHPKCTIKCSPHVKEIKGGLYATIIIKGSYEKSIEKYNMLVNWIEENDYQISGPAVRSYLTTFASARKVADLVSEIQLPVTKK